MSSGLLKISVVVCTYNGAKKIEKCLKALQKQTLKTGEYEVIVVIDGSKDDTANILIKYSFIKVIINKTNLGLSHSRNVGVAAAKAQILAFTDDDCVPDKNWLRNLLKVYSNSVTIGAGGNIIPYKTNTWLLKYYELNNPLSHLTLELNKSSGIVFRFLQYFQRSFVLNELPATTKLLSIVGANMSMRKSTYELVGGFDKDFRSCGDDDDFWTRLRILKSDADLEYVSNAIIRHDYNPSIKDAFRRNKSYGGGSAILLQKHHDRLPAIFPFPVLIILSLFGLLISPYSLLFTLLTILILYPGWTIKAVRNLRPQYLLYPFVQSSLEFMSSYGFIKRYAQLKKTT